MDIKFYIFDNREDAQSLVDVLTNAVNEGIPYTEVRASDNGKGFAVQNGTLTRQYTDLTPEYLPYDFYLEDAGV